MVRFFTHSIHLYLLQRHSIAFAKRWRPCPVCPDRARDAKLAERNRQLTSRFGRSYSRSGCDKRPNRYRAQPHAVRHNVAVILMARMTCALWLIMISCSPQE